MRVNCADCGWYGQEGKCDEIQALAMRIDPGGEVPAGECPKCGALCYVVEADNVYAKPVRELKRQKSELLACLKGAERFMSGFEDDQIQQPSVNARLRRIRRVIARAEGRKV